MKNKYRIIYDTDDIQKISDCYGMDKVLYILLEIKMKNWELVKIINLSK